MTANGITNSCKTVITYSYNLTLFNIFPCHMTNVNLMNSNIRTAYKNIKQQ